MGFLDKFKTKKPPATEKQIQYLQGLGNNVSDERFEYVLRSCGHNPADGAGTILANLTEDQADELISAFLFVPATEKQISFIQSLIYRWDPDQFGIYDGANQRTLDERLAIAQPQGDYMENGSFSHVSKNDATHIIGQLKALDDE